MITEMITSGIEATKAMFGQAPRTYGLSPEDFSAFCDEQNLRPTNGRVQWNGLLIRSREALNGPATHSRDWNRIKGEKQ